MENFRKINGYKGYFEQFCKELLYFGHYKNFTLMATIEFDGVVLISVGNMAKNQDLTENEIEEIMKELGFENRKYDTWNFSSLFRLKTKYFKITETEGSN
ncbi:hypothetical protein DXA30_07960 [Fusobacterium ulcerans]|uniref:hypothetical protein n=1 Tax=Fusobacterium ulcerans TaxID=861 RepID=UPI000E4DDD97|nr:hypothetical protein [Fusobacterium ulcerans]RGY64493.1 hypothetical protein DXA30_07960 [Fusobacterium ulcerans]